MVENKVTNAVRINVRKDYVVLTPLQLKSVYYNGQVEASINSQITRKSQ